MRHFLTLGSGLLLGLIASILLLSAGFPPAFAAAVLWIVGGAIGLSLIQFAFLKRPIAEAVETAGKRPLRSFLVGVLVMEVPILAASLIRLGGAEELGALCLLAFFGGLLVLYWPAAVAFQIGQRLSPQHSGARQVTAGTMVATSSLMIPVLGWIWIAVLATTSLGGWCLRGRYA